MSQIISIEEDVKQVNSEICSSASDDSDFELVRKDDFIININQALARCKKNLKSVETTEIPDLMPFLQSLSDLNQYVCEIFENEINLIGNNYIENIVDYLSPKKFKKLSLKSVQIEKDLINFQKKINQSSLTIDRKRTKIEAMKQKIEEMKKENDNAYKKIVEMKQENDNAYQKIEEMRQEIEVMKQENDNAYQKIDEMNQENDNAYQKIEVMKQEIEEMKQENDNAYQKTEVMKEEIDNSVQKIASKKQKIINLKEQIKNLGNEILNKNLEIEAKNETINRNEKELNEKFLTINELVTELERKKNEIVNNSMKFAENEAKYKLDIEKLQQAGSRSKEFESIIDEICRENEKKSKDYESIINEKNRELEEKNLKIKAKKKKITDLQEIVLYKKNKNVIRNKSQMFEINKSLEKSVAFRFDDLNSSVPQETTSMFFSSFCSMKNNEIKQIESQKIEIDELKNEIFYLKQTIRDKEQKIKQIESQKIGIHELKNKILNLEKKIQEKDTELSKFFQIKEEVQNLQNSETKLHQIITSKKAKIKSIKVLIKEKDIIIDSNRKDIEIKNKKIYDQEKIIASDREKNIRLISDNISLLAANEKQVLKISQHKEEIRTIIINLTDTINKYLFELLRNTSSYIDQSLIDWNKSIVGDHSICANCNSILPRSICFCYFCHAFNSIMQNLHNYIQTLCQSYLLW